MVGIAPGFRLLANSQDITDTIDACLISLRMTDEDGTDSDELELVLADDDPLAPIAMPPTGAELELFLGYDGQAVRKGLFVVDEIELAAWPGRMTIRAKAAPFEKSKGGKANLQSQKTRAWEAGTTLGALVQKIAGEHGLEPIVSRSLASIQLPHLSQSDESDGHLLVRVARKYDALVKPAGGKLVLAKRGEGTTPSGRPLPAFTLEPGDVSSWDMSLAKRESSGCVVAAWHNTGAAKRYTVTVGTGEPVTRLRMQYPTRDAAMSAASAEMDKRARGESQLRVTLPGDPALIAEARLQMRGFREGVAGAWLIKRVEHSLSNTGYSCSIEAEKPNPQTTKPITETED